MAALLVGLFVIGLWMVELNYYDDWYHQAPQLHKSLGLLVIAMWFVRLLWRLFDRLPEPEANIKIRELRLAKAMHRFFYVLIFLLVFAGYMITTGEDAGIEFFGLFEVPAIFSAVEEQADVAGWIHWALSWLLMICVLLHTSAALLHHYSYRDRTLLKMLGRKP
tara:strand:- start:597 stop:1088 length:492 start_codon:yes stop_codon:yes gene_type:complete